VCNLAVIRCGSILAFVWRRRIVRIVRIVKMDPEEEWTFRMLVQPCNRTSNHLPSAAFPRLISVERRMPLLKTSIIGIESAFETMGKALLRIEDHRPDERRCLISVGVQDVRRVG